MAIGNTPLSRIHGTGASLVTTPTNVGLTDSGAPFGGLVRLRMEFDNSLRDELNVRYYRVSWKRAGTLADFVPLDLEVHRHYAHFVGSTLAIDAIRWDRRPSETRLCSTRFHPHCRQSANG